MRIAIYSLLILAALLVYGCQKELNTPDQQERKAPGSTGTPNQSATTGPRLAYSDSLFFLRNQSGNYTVLPVSKPSAAGYFKAIPRGLVLDSATGRINVTLSQAGMRYKIFYVGTNNTAIDSVKIVISGIDYRDAIYEIARTPNAYDTAFPIYNARPELPLPCGDDDEDDDGDLDDDDNQCVFDETDLNDDGNDDIAGVIQDKLLVDIKKGTIDVEASFHAGIFGSSNPANGVFKDFTMYYRLQDASNRALNKITVRVYHYRRRSDIPQSLLNLMNTHAAISNQVNLRTIDGADGIDAYAKPRRPPIIVIVSQ
jgi:hypothetical protein